MAFTSDVLVERTRTGQRQTVKEQGAIVEASLFVHTICTYVSNKCPQLVLKSRSMAVKCVVHYHFMAVWAERSFEAVLFILSVYISEHLCHVYVRSDNLSCVVIADHDYPSRVCFTLMNKVRASIHQDNNPYIKTQQSMFGVLGVELMLLSGHSHCSSACRPHHGIWSSPWGICYSVSAFSLNKSKRSMWFIAISKLLLHSFSTSKGDQYSRTSIIYTLSNSVMH